VPTLSELRGSALQESKSQLAASNEECKRLQAALDGAVASASNIQATQETANPALREELQKLSKTLEIRVAIDSDEARENMAREEASKRTEAYLIRKAAAAEANATQLRNKVNELEAEIEVFQNIEKVDQDESLEPIGELCNERISEQMSSLQTELKRVTRERDSALENIRVIAAEKRQYEANFTQMENQLSELDELVAILEKERDDLSKVDDELNRLKIGNSKLLDHKIRHGAIMDYPSQQIQDPISKAEHPDKILRGLEDMVQSLTQEKQSLLHLRDNLEKQLQEAKNGVDNLQFEHTSLVQSKAESDLEISRLNDVCASLTQ
jgi:chromosome segregation ATPase